jgi:hypothetical protein
MFWNPCLYQFTDSSAKGRELDITSSQTPPHLLRHEIEAACDAEGYTLGKPELGPVVSLK